MRWVRRVVLGFAALAALILLIILGVGWYIAPQDKLERADAIIVVSGGDTVKRTDEGVRLWKGDWAPKLIFSGAAADQGTSNAAVMRSQAVQQGVPLNATLIEERSTNTRENAEDLKPIVSANGVKNMILVSSPYHTRRVKTTFQKIYGKGYHFIAHPAKDTVWARSSWWQQASTVSLTWDELRKTLYVAFLQH